MLRDSIENTDNMKGQMENFSREMKTRKKDLIKTIEIEE